MEPQIGKEAPKEIYPLQSMEVPPILIELAREGGNENRLIKQCVDAHVGKSRAETVPVIRVTPQTME